MAQTELTMNSSNQTTKFRIRRAKVEATRSSREFASDLEIFIFDSECSF